VKKNDLRLDELLGRGGLGGPEYDRILKMVLARTTPRPAWRTTWLLAPAAGLSLAAVAVALALVRPGGGAFAPKGDALTASTALSIGCGPSSSRICRVGDTLMFEVNTAVASGYIGAYAEPAGAPAGQRIWYFPGASGIAPRVDRGPGTVVVPEGIFLGPEHAPGKYRVTIWLSIRPLGRAEVDSVGAESVRARTTLDLEIVPG